MLTKSILTATAGAASAGDATRAGDVATVIKAPQEVNFETTANTRPEAIETMHLRAIRGAGINTFILVSSGIVNGIAMANSNSNGTAAGFVTNETGALNSARGFDVVIVNPSLP